MINIKDLYEMKFLSDISYSPDGKNAIFIVHNADEDKNNYRSYLWLIDLTTGVKSQLTFQGDERKYIWLDSEKILFTSQREKKEDKNTQFFTLSIRGGEGKPTFTIPEAVATFRMIDDTHFLIVCSRNAAEAPKKEENRAELLKDYTVFDEIPFWTNGKGVTNKLRRMAMIWSTETRELTPISKPLMDVGEVMLSADRNSVLYTASEFENVRGRPGGLYLYDINSKETKTLEPQEKLSFADICFTSDKVFYTAMSWEWPGRNPNYYTFNLKTGEKKCLPFLDQEAGNGVGSDSAYGGGRAMKYSVGRVYLIHSNDGDSQLVSLNSQGDLLQHTNTPGAVLCMDVFGKSALMVAMRDSRLGELYRVDLATGAETRLTDFNTKYLEEKAPVQPEEFQFTNADGVMLHGYVVKPANYDATKKYPAVLEIHGGPKAIFGSVYHHEMQVFSSRGYFVFYTNPRGSAGRGEDFANLTAKLGTIDYNDLMELTAQVMERYPQIDKRRVGACGGSYGGFMVNWMIGHTDFFAAGIAQRSISNYLTKSLTTDIGFNHNMSQLGTDPWEDFETVWKTSPLAEAKNAKTPTLFIQSDQDYRCWMSEPLQMFNALKQNGVDSKICLFHGENHELSRSGKPLNRVDRLREMAEWFDKYLQK